MRRLVVVDDEEDVLDFVERVFRREYRVERARSVEEAEPLLACGDVDVLITDQRMPHRSGYELLVHARADHPRTVRVLLTGYTAPGDPDDGADVHLVKPIDGETLRAAVAEATARKHLVDEQRPFAALAPA